MFRRLIAAGCLTVLATGAQAQEHPAFLPTRDVAVTYRLDGGQGASAQTTHMYFSPAAGKLRIDTPNDGGFTVLDRTAHQRLMVMNQDHAFAAVPLEPGGEDGWILNPSMDYHRQGQSTVAGLGCTEWSFSSPQGAGTVCITADGVLLRGTGHSTAGPASQTGMVAVKVDYAAQPATLFEAPAGFRKMDPRELEGPQPGQGEPAGAPGGPPVQGGPRADGPGNGQ